MTGVVDARDERVKLLEGDDRLVPAAIDREIAQRRFACSSQRARRALDTGGLVALAPACDGRRRCGEEVAGGRGSRRLGCGLAGPGAAAVARVRIDIGGIDLRIV